MQVSGFTSAHRNMEEQSVFHTDTHEYSLDAMWRAVGKPPGESPGEWLELASKLIEGIADYRAKVSALYPDSNEWDFGYDPKIMRKMTLEEIRDFAKACRESGMEYEHDPFWRDGDTLAIPEIAEYYARHLDARDPNARELELRNLDIED